jgi:hypothetical protein
MHDDECDFYTPVPRRVNPVGGASSAVGAARCGVDFARHAPQNPTGDFW